MQDINDKINNMHMGKLIHMLSHEMKRNQPIDKVIKADLTIMQKHILKFILLETMHKDLYQKDIEEEFQIRKSTVTGILKLMEKHGYIYRESVKEGCQAETDRSDCESRRDAAEDPGTYPENRGKADRRDSPGGCSDLQKRHWDRCCVICQK